MRTVGAILSFKVHYKLRIMHYEFYQMEKLITKHIFMLLTSWLE